MRRAIRAQTDTGGQRNGLNEPFITVVLCTYDRPRRLAEFLAGMAGQTMDRSRFELVVVDDGSSPPVAPVVEPFLSRLPIRLFRQANAGVARSRNAGAGQARGRFLAFTDDDNQLPPDWLERLAARCRRDPDALIGGHTVNANDNDLYARASMMILDVAYRWHNTDPFAPRFFHGGNMTVSRQGFLELGGFDPRYGKAGAEDRGFCASWAAAERPLVYAPEVTVVHAHYHLNLRAFWIQHRGYGRGARIYHQLHTGRSAPVPLRRQLAFYGMLLAAPFRHGQRLGWRALPVLALLVISRLANCAGFFAEARRDSDLRPVPRPSGSPDQSNPAGER